MTLRTLVAHRSGAMLMAVALALVALLVVVLVSSPRSPASAEPPPPTATPVPVDFSIGTDAYSGAGDICDSSGTPTSVCLVRPGTMFTIYAYLNQLPSDLPGGDYEVWEGDLSYAGVTSPAMILTYWPDCAFAGNALPPGGVHFGCSIGLGAPQSSYTGKMSSVNFTCTSDGTVSLLHGLDHTKIWDGIGSPYYEPAGSESLTIDCVDPLAYPGDSDGDGCPDANEAQTAMGSELTGGRRNWVNPWDYFNSLGDGQNRIEDVLWVIYHYFIDEGNPGYTQDVDRSYVGPDPWDLGSPDGIVHIEDILFERDQTWHDCS